MLERPQTNRENPENIFFDKLFGESRDFYWPIYLPDYTLQPEIRVTSGRSVVREILESPRTLKSDEELEKAMWNILKQLLACVTENENNPTTGYLNDEKFIRYASEPVKSFIEEAQKRLANKETNPLVKLVPLSEANGLISHYQMGTHLLFVKNFFNNPSNCHTILLNSYKKREEVLIREGGTSNLNYTGYLSVQDDNESEPVTRNTSNGITFSWANGKEGATQSGEPFMGDTFITGHCDKIRVGDWLPIQLSKGLALGVFRFSSLSQLECDYLRRLYWEETMRHLGGEFDYLANFSSNHKKNIVPVFDTMQTPQ